MSTRVMTSPQQDTGRPRTPVPWLTVGALAVVLAYADGFWLTSVEGAVGAIERAQEPFSFWLRQSTVMLPVFVLAVLAALALGRRRLGPVLRRPRQVVAAALLVVVAGSLVGATVLGLSAAHDYRLQVHQLEVLQSAHAATLVDPAPDDDCVGLCAAKRATLSADVRALGYGTGAVVLTNLVLVGWVVALRGGRLDPVRRVQAA